MLCALVLCADGVAKVNKAVRDVFVSGNDERRSGTLRRQLPQPRVARKVHKHCFLTVTLRGAHGEALPFAPRPRSE